MNKRKESLPAPVMFGDLAERFPRLRRPIIEGILREGESASIISHTKIGKSWLAGGLVLSIATGRDWLDRFPVRQGRVLLIDNELHRETIVSRLRTVANAMMIPPEEFAESVEVLALRGNLRDIFGLWSLLENVEREAYRLIVIDAWYRVLPPNVSENDNAQIAGVFNMVDHLADQLGCGIVAVHHTSKGNQTDKRVTDVGSGAGSQSRAVDAHIVLREHQEPNHAVMAAAVRSWPPLEPVVLRWEYPTWQIADAADPKALKRQPTRGQQAQSERDCEGIASITRSLTGGRCTRRRLRELAGMGADRLNRLIAQMHDDGLVTYATDENGTEVVEGVVCHSDQ